MAVGPNATQVHHHSVGKGRATAQHTDTSQRHTGADQERDGVYQPPSQRVCLHHP